MKNSGSADLALMGGSIPPWLMRRMEKLSLAVTEAIIIEYGKAEFLRRLSDPFWFQSFGAVIGMDWNSSGVTTAVMRALRRSINPHAKELGLFVCGGKGKESLKTPRELLRVGEITGLDGELLGQHSKLSAKVDNNAVQDGFQLYLHSFVVSSEGDWTVVQQGMQGKTKKARRYHWHSAGLDSFVQDPHAGICGEHQGEIMNLVDKRAAPAQSEMLAVVNDAPEKMLREVRKLLLHNHCSIRPGDVDVKRLGSILWLAQESQMTDFKDLLLLKGLGPRTLQSLALVSEVIHGAPARFDDPARFVFAHGSKNNKVFPVATKVYDETFETLRKAVDLAKIGENDRGRAIRKLSELAQQAETGFTSNDRLEELIDKERRDSYKYGGRSVDGFAEKPEEDGQLGLFDNQGR